MCDSVQVFVDGVSRCRSRNAKRSHLAALPFGGSDNAWNLVGDRGMRNARSLALSYSQLSMRGREFRLAVACMLLREWGMGVLKGLSMSALRFAVLQNPFWRVWF